jgi:hypothetical protein
MRTRIEQLAFSMYHGVKILVELSDKNTTRVTVQRNTTRVYRFHGEPTIQIDKESKCGVKLFRFGKKKNQSDINAAC